MTNLSRTVNCALHLALLAGAATLLTLHFVHLSADFPNFSPWSDWSKYTDEGWYGDAAIRHVQLGHWYLPGDFNPAVALPVWPLLEAAVFHFARVSIIAARALSVSVFAGILIATWLLITRHSPNGRRSLAAPVAVLLLAASPFCFVFTRLAIIEPLLILLTLLTLLAASYIRPATLKANFLPILAVGLLLPLMVLAKTTALFLVPAIFWMLFAASGYRLKRFLSIAALVALVGLSMWLLYFLAFVRPHYLLDYRYLFSANAYTGITADTFFDVLEDTLEDGQWMGQILYPLALAAVAVALSQLSRLKDYPFIPALLFWCGGYAAFLAYHDNLQPRYYLVIAVPLTLLLAVVVEDLILPSFQTSISHTCVFTLTAITLGAIVATDATQTIRYVRQPEYTFVNAARDIAYYIHQDHNSDPTHSSLILSVSGSDISLITGLHSISDEFGTMQLADKVALYKPGWYITWNQVEDARMDALTPHFTLERVATFPAMDDADRNLLILYKLYPTGSQPPRPPSPRRVTPRTFRTRVGEQPSVEQLKH